MPSKASERPGARGTRGTRRAAATEQATHLSLTLDVLRQEGPDARPYHQLIAYETDDAGESVASALRAINAAGDVRDLEGRPVGTIAWESSCLQRRCGACAMVVDGTPALACGSLLRDHEGTGPLTLAPLSKFPVVADLRVDRSVLLDNLRSFGMWEDAPAEQDERSAAVALAASRCLQCGCCLEACPNFAPGGPFFGAAGFVPATRLFSTLPKGERERVRRSYLAHEYEGCGLSLACARVCPAEVDIEALLARSNAAALFRR